jgi:starch phosphorylase
LRAAIELVESGLFAPDQPGVFQDLTESLRHSDPYLVCADFDAYLAAQGAAALRFENREAWLQASLRNVSQSGEFSSDRAIRQYADEIWDVSRVRT